MEHVANLWFDSREGVSWSGYLTLPRPLPAGVSLRVIAVPYPRGRTKEKYELFIEFPLDFLPEPPELEDIFPRGMRMTYFEPAKASDRRDKVFIYGKPGTGKSLAALSFPQAYYLDNHGSVEKYEIAYPQHLFGRVVKPDDIMAAVSWALSNPGDRRTFVLDDITVYEERLYIKWGKLFLMRQPGSKGDHKEFYTMQPGDYMHPKRELRTMVRRLLLMDLNVIVIARAAKEYVSDGKDFMKATGEDTFAGEKGLPHEFDFVFQFVMEGDKRHAITKIKQRQTPGVPLFPAKFEFHIDENGRCDFYDLFKKYDNPDNFTREALQVRDPEKDEVFPAEASATPFVAPTTTVNQAPAPETAAPETAKPAELATTAPATIATTDPAPATASGKPGVTVEQLQTLKSLKDYYKITNEDWGKTLEKFYGVKTAKVLDQEQADKFIEYLKNQRVPF